MGKEISMEERAKKARAMRYKRPALESMGYEQMVRELEEIAEACSDIRYYDPEFFCGGGERKEGDDDG